MKHSKLLALALVGFLVAVTACDSTSPTPAQALLTATSQPEATPPEPTATPVPAPTNTSEPLAAVVNGEQILLEEYERQVARYEASMVAAGQDPSTPEGQSALAQGRQWVLDLMVEQMLIEDAATAVGLVVSDADVDATIAGLRADIGDEAFDAWLVQEDMTVEEMRERLRGDMLATQMANRVAESVQARAEHVHARHIVVATEEEARLILSQLQAGGDFASLARMYSQDISTRDVGGDLGFFPAGVLTSKEVEAAALALQPGQLSDVVPSDLGFHIVQVVERVPDREVDPENLRLLRDQAVRVWLDGLKSSADIQIFVVPES
ncbi:MAG: peptidylprolyl isomerase [Anaerolineae bacterium]|nr:peptidylprolyl isomerase [Anaerolineae bacterium]